MRRAFLSLLTALGLAGAAAAAEPIEGLWQTEVDDGAFALVEIERCGAAYCGTIARAFDATGEIFPDGLGERIVRDMIPQGGGRYEGQVWRPSNERVYRGRIAVEGDRMSLRGCVAGGLICAGQTWVRVR